jgi:hypothetical protein
MFYDRMIKVLFLCVVALAGGNLFAYTTNVSLPHVFIVSDDAESGYNLATLSYTKNEPYSAGASTYYATNLNVPFNHQVFHTVDSSDYIAYRFCYTLSDNSSFCDASAVLTVADYLTPVDTLPPPLDLADTIVEFQDFLFAFLQIFCFMAGIGFGVYLTAQLHV